MLCPALRKFARTATTFVLLLVTFIAAGAYAGHRAQHQASVKVFTEVTGFQVDSID